MLFTLFQSPWQCDLDSIFLLLQENDDILLLQDGVTAALKDSVVFLKMKNMFSNIWVLQEDVIARGLNKYISPTVEYIDYNGFVSLTVKHQQQIAW